jgi:hypothetical protein
MKAFAVAGRLDLLAAHDQHLAARQRSGAGDFDGRSAEQVGIAVGRVDAIANIVDPHRALVIARQLGGLRRPLEQFRFRGGIEGSLDQAPVTTA